MGWYIFVRNLTFGGLIGYSSGKNSSNLNIPSGQRIVRVNSGEGDNRFGLVKLTHVGMGSHLVLGSSHQNTAGCHREVQLRYQVQGLPRDALFPTIPEGYSAELQDYDFVI